MREVTLRFTVGKISKLYLSENERVFININASNLSASVLYSLVCNCFQIIVNLGWHFFLHGILYVNEITQFGIDTSASSVFECSHISRKTVAPLQEFNSLKLLDVRFVSLL